MFERLMARLTRRRRTATAKAQPVTPTKQAPTTPPLEDTAMQQESPQEPQQQETPDYRPLERALEASEAQRFDHAFTLLDRAWKGLRRFAYTECLFFASAALINAQYTNLGSAGRYVERAVVAYARDCRKLTREEQHFAFGAIKRTLALVPIERLHYGTQITADRDRALEHLKKAEYGYALACLQRAVTTVKQQTCLRLHPSKPLESLEMLIHEICTKLEGYPQEERMRQLRALYQEAGSDRSPAQATA